MNNVNIFSALYNKLTCLILDKICMVLIWFERLILEYEKCKYF
jgi:hypothetical protein